MSSVLLHCRSHKRFSGYAFSKNKKPTILPIPDNNVPIGLATEMSCNDILRVKRLYCG
ncbi:six-cysteine containing astacin protease 1 precursor [Silurus asotus]|uniref:Six-cysteine containing astacin protease 1 n=1 Tax=Silurus asotus TaxID=30991 RepID=A0AAD5FIT1_SILAS|nr:six-cysteine containing astacin protease 1 precursor [Silurus asotus]